MRVAKENKDISVRAIAGTNVILFGINVPKAAAKTLLGFKIERLGKSKNVQLKDGRKFAGREDSLIQEFQWGDYSVKPGTTYTYNFYAVHGTPDMPKAKRKLQLKVTTENNDDGENAVYFNRGVAGSQSYARNFSEYQKWYKTDAFEEDPKKIRFKRFLKPEDVPKKDAYKWLSRGLEEALLNYIGQAKDERYAIRASLYELSHLPAANAFVEALDRGVDVKIVHHSKKVTSYKLRRDNKANTTIKYEDDRKDVTYKSKELIKIKSGDGIYKTAMTTMARVGISNVKAMKAFKEMLLPRTQMAISHNKFIILLKDGKPIQVWTGSTNITGGGIYGQSNVGQITRNKKIAEAYLAYWTKLSGDPKKKSTGSDAPDKGIKNWLQINNPNLKGPVEPNSTHAIFSPRMDTKALQWYADQIKNAKESVFFTAAFSMDERILKVVRKNKSKISGPVFQRYLLLEGISGLMRDKYPKLKKSTQNRIAWGDSMKKRPGELNPDTFIETLTGLNDHVNYIHTKFMLIDPLSDDPLVVSGSANFSEASTVNNDENMLIIRGNTRVADIFLGEFMRIFTHFLRRNSANSLSDDDFKVKSHLDSTSKWTKPFFTKGTPEYDERVLFSKR